MRSIKYTAFVTLLTLFSLVSKGQNLTIDSLKRILYTQKEDSNRVTTLNNLGTALSNNGNNDEAMKVADNAILLSKKINFRKGEGVAYSSRSLVNFKVGNYPAALSNSQSALKIYHEAGLKFEEAKELSWLGTVCKQQYNYEAASQYFDSALNIYKALKDNNRIGRAYVNIGDLQRIQDNFSEALKNFFEALKILEETGKDPALGYARIAIAYTYFDIGDYSESLKYNQAALEIYREMKDEFRMAICYKNMGDCYLKLSRLTEALDTCLLALKSFQKWGDQSWVASDYTSVGNIYEAIGIDELLSGNKGEAKRRFNEALKYYLLGLEINEKTKFNIDDSHYNLGNIYTKLNRLEEARNSFEISLKISKETNYKRQIKRIYLGLSKVDSLEGDYKRAYEHYQKHILYRDSLGDERNSRALVELKLQYEFDKKEAAAKLAQLETEGEQNRKRAGQWRVIASLGFLILVFLLIMVFQWRGSKQRKRANLLLQQEKEKVESTLSELRSTQSQLIQSEKMASLGELTAGIAHEIQNPLNFVNNFSDVNKELLDELKGAAGKGNIDEVKAIADDVIQNEEKINHHGKRADAIVKGMLQHSRAGSGQKELTDINSLVDEYLRLAYHGFRAKDKSFNATTKTEFDDRIGKVNVVPRDIGRVILNLINNAFYAVSEKQKAPQPPNGGVEYEPTVKVSTKAIKPPSGGLGVEIKVKDNGNGIPQKNLDKIFQPFFTTKPTGQGTGLGLSLAYDIITKGHGGELKVETKGGEGAEFIISLPMN